MSLKVWLPLLGSVENKGTTNYQITSTNVVSDADGKIGKCCFIRKDGNASHLLLQPALFDNNTTEWSYACWLYPQDPGGNYHCLFSNRSMVADNGIAIFVGTGSSYAGHTFFDTGTRYDASMTVPLNAWTHLAFTFKRGSVKKIYMNGVEVASTSDNSAAPICATTTACSIGASQSGPTTPGGNYMKGKLNDVRIYDHCLSAAEVKELAKGLVVHYKLDDIEPNPNLLIDSNVASLTAVRAAANRYVESGGSGTYSVTIERSDDVPVAGIKYVTRQLNTAGNYMHSMTFYSSVMSITVGTTYTMSCYVKNITGASGLNFRFQYGKSPYVSADQTLIADTSWHQYSWTFTPNDQAAASNSTRIYCGGLTSLNAEVLICGYKLEVGSVATPWIPNTIEPEYNILKKRYAVDSSGFNYNGTINNAIKYSTVSPRYNASALFNSSFIRRDNFVFDYSKITVSCWAKYDSDTTNTNYLVSLNSYNGVGYADHAFAISVQNNLVYYVVGGNSSATYSTTNTVLTGGWNHFALTYDGATIKGYFNGTQVVSLASTTILTGRNTLSIGCRKNGTSGNLYFVSGGISDVRIYATCFSADDVAALYNMSARIDKAGNAYAYSFEETDKVNIKKNGCVQSVYASELLPNLHYDRNVYIEPDHSEWVRIAHQNNPSVNRFASTDSFAIGAYVNEDYWYDLEQNVDCVSTYEFMVKQTITAGATETKYRWVQTVKPTVAVWDDVKPANVTRITTTGYTDGTFGGIFVGGNGNTRARIANNNSGNWFGAFGSWTLYQGGTPGYPSTVVQTGYMDLYMRIDNYIDLCTKITKNGIYSKNIIEM